MTLREALREAGCDLTNLKLHYETARELDIPFSNVPRGFVIGWEGGRVWMTVYDGAVNYAPTGPINEHWRMAEGPFSWEGK